MGAIFISYRRDDSEGQAGRLFDDLKTHFGEDSVFLDVVGLEAGRDFRRAIDDQLSNNLVSVEAQHQQLGAFTCELKTTVASIAGRCTANGNYAGDIALSERGSLNP